MALVEFFRYTDAYGDQVIYEFDPIVAQAQMSAQAEVPQNSRAPNIPDHESAVIVYVSWFHENQYRSHWATRMLTKEEVKKRFASDKKPQIGKVMLREKGQNGTTAVWLWKGYGAGWGGEGWMRVWARE